MCPPGVPRQIASGPARSRRGGPEQVVTGRLTTVSARHVHDLTRVFAAGFPVASSATSPPRRQRRLDYARDGFSAHQWTFDEHTSTHVDAPIHIDPAGRDVTALTANELLLPLRVLSIRERAQRDPDSLLTPKDVLAHEARHRAIPPGSAILLHTGWDSRDAMSGDYLNVDAGGVAHSPGYSAEAVELLLARDVACIGTDTGSLDSGSSTDYSAHHAWLGAGLFGIEGVIRAGEVPPSGAHLVVGVVPWEHGSGGPCRLLALW